MSVYRNGLLDLFAFLVSSEQSEPGNEGKVKSTSEAWDHDLPKSKRALA